MKAEASVAPVAERLVVDAEMVVEVETVSVPMVDVAVYEVPKVDDAEERAVVDAVFAVSALTYADEIVAPVAERLVVEAFVIVAVPVVLVFTNDAPFAERLVVEALVMNAFTAENRVVVASATKRAPIVPEAAEKSVVDAFEAKRLVVDANVLKKSDVVALVAKRAPMVEDAAESCVVDAVKMVDVEVYEAAKVEDAAESLVVDAVKMVDVEVYVIPKVDDAAETAVVEASTV